MITDYLLVDISLSGMLRVVMVNDYSDFQYNYFSLTESLCGAGRGGAGRGGAGRGGAQSLRNYLCTYMLRQTNDGTSLGYPGSVRWQHL